MSMTYRTKEILANIEFRDPVREKRYLKEILEMDRWEKQNGEIKTSEDVGRFNEYYRTTHLKGKGE